jgi:hypothetical protein
MLKYNNSSDKEVFTKSKVSKAVLAAVLASSLLAIRIDAQIVQNPSFETPNLGGSWQYQPSGASWSFSTFSGITASTFEWGHPVVPDGAQVAILQSWGPGAPSPWTNSEISQTIPGFTVGQNYYVQFSASQRNLGQIQNQDFSVLLDNKTLGQFQPSGTNFQSFRTVPFTATAPSHTLRFVALNSAGYSVNEFADNTALIDNVKIEKYNVIYTLQMQAATNASGGYTNIGSPLYLTNPPALNMFFRIQIQQTHP